MSDIEQKLKQLTKDIRSEKEQAEIEARDARLKLETTSILCLRFLVEIENLQELIKKANPNGIDDKG